MLVGAVYLSAVGEQWTTSRPIFLSPHQYSWATQSAELPTLCVEAQKTTNEGVYEAVKVNQKSELIEEEWWLISISATIGLLLLDKTSDNTNTYTSPVYRCVTATVEVENSINFALGSENDGDGCVCFAI